MPPPAAAWLVEHRTGTAADLHGPWPSDEFRAERVVALCDVIGYPTVVLGSSQGDLRVDAKSLEIARRSSGGGAVLVTPGAQVWVDVWLPRGDPLWDDDVVRSSGWLGTAWLEALGDLGVDDLEVHSGRLARSRWSDVICFAGVGPGEVRWRSRKLVGLAQRRNRAGARFHTVSPLDPVRVSDLPVEGCDSADLRDIDTFLAAESTCLVEAVASAGSDSGERTAILERVARSVMLAVTGGGLAGAGAGAGTGAA